MSNCNRFKSEESEAVKKLGTASGRGRGRGLESNRWARHELLRRAIPRRVYTQSHIDYVVEAILEVNERKQELRGFEIVSQPRFLRHFSCRLRPL